MQLTESSYSAHWNIFDSPLRVNMRAHHENLNRLILSGKTVTRFVSKSIINVFEMFSTFLLGDYLKYNFGKKVMLQSQN